MKEKQIDKIGFIFLIIIAETDKTYDTFEISIVEVTRYFSEKTIGRISFQH